MRDSSLFIVTLGVILVNVCSCNAQNFGRSSEDEPLRMASDSLVVKSYREDEDNGPTEELDFRSYQGVMGRPGIDFPVLRNIPATDFNCRDVKRPGYYADLATDCQVFHICDGGRKISFLCPNGTIFRQSHLICDWWFRVDCGKSVELYEESAEQLAADQKIYQARSIERERKRRPSKTTLADGEEDASDEVYGLDEPFDGRSRTRERNSKKVLDSKSAEKFPNYYKPGKDEGRKSNEDKIKFNRGNDGRAFNNHSPPSDNYQAYTPAPNTFSTSNYKSRGFVDNHRNRENIQGAESGSLVGNLRNSARNDNSLSFDAKLPEIKVRIPTTSERPLFNIRTSTESRRQDFFRASTFRPDNARRFFDSTASTTGRDFQQVRSHNLIRTTPKYATAEKYSTPETAKFFPAAEHKRFSTPKPGSSTPSPFSRSIPTSESSNRFKETEAREDDNLTTEIIPVETVYYRTFGSDKDGDGTTTSRVDISLSQLNINKPTTQPDLESKNYEDAVRLGLEIPPSSGPNALRSFALYFAGNGGDAFRKGKDNAEEPKDLFYIPTVTEVEQKLNNLEENTESVIQNADNTEIKDKTVSEKEASPAVEALPKSLTQQTRNSYSALFDKNHTKTERFDHTVTEPEFGTTAFEGFTEDAEKINLELRKNDLDSSQSRGLVEPDSNNNNLNDEFSRVSPDLRELAQVFTKALSAYLDDPEAFRKVLSEIRPTEPSATEATTIPVDYPSVTQEDDEVLDFSDVTKSSYRRRTTTVAYRETTTEEPTETPTTIKDVENFIVGSAVKQNLSHIRVPSVELTAPLLENLDESQSSYYTPPPNSVGTTNAIAEEINNGFAGAEKLPDIDSNEAVDSYLPIKGSVDDKSRPRYGGFQNNTNYSPYGSELSTKPYSPYGSELTSTTTATSVKESGSSLATTFNPRNISSSIFFRRKPEAIIKKSSGQESVLAKQLNNLAAPEDDKSATIIPPVPKFESIKLGNGETIERTRTRGTTARPIISTQVYVESRGLSREKPVTSSQVYQGPKEQIRSKLVAGSQVYQEEKEQSRAKQVVHTQVYGGQNEQSRAKAVTNTQGYVGQNEQSRAKQVVNTQVYGGQNEQSRAKQVVNTQVYEGQNEQSRVKAVTNTQGYVGQNEQSRTKPVSKTQVYLGQNEQSRVKPVGNAQVYVEQNEQNTAKPVADVQDYTERNEQSRSKLVVDSQAYQEQKERNRVEPVANTEVHADRNEERTGKLVNSQVYQEQKDQSRGKSVSSSQVYQEPKELSIELIPPYSTDPSDGYYEFDASLNKNSEEEFQTTTNYPTTVTDIAAETFIPTAYTIYEGSTNKYARSTTEEVPTDSTAPTPKSFERIAELQQTLMFNSQNITHQQMEKARITVAEAVDNMTDSTADALMKMMEMAAKNETYRRLVLLLVNDKSGKNKTVEETRLALLRALLMPVISTSRTRRLDVDYTTTTLPPATTLTTPAATTIKDAKRRQSHFRRSKSISNGETRNVVRITTEPPKERAKNGRKTKARLVSRIVKTTEVPTTTFSQNRLSNQELINRTVEISKAKDIKSNSLEDAILDSDSRAVELLRSLYSLAARWG